MACCWPLSVTLGTPAMRLRPRALVSQSGPSVMACMIRWASSAMAVCRGDAPPVASTRTVMSRAAWRATAWASSVCRALTFCWRAALTMEWQLDGSSVGMAPRTDMVPSLLLRKLTAALPAAETIRSTRPLPARYRVSPRCFSATSGPSLSLIQRLSASIRSPAAGPAFSLTVVIVRSAPPLLENCETLFI